MSKKNKKKYQGKKRSLEEKRRRIAEQKKAQKTTTIMIVAGVLIILVALALGISYSQSRRNQVGGQTVAANQDYNQAVRLDMTDIEVGVENGKITVPVSVVKDKKLVSYVYNGTSQPTPLLAYISPSGKIVTAVSMCEPCKSTRFHIEGDQMVCNACGTRWTLDTLKGISGGCMDFPPDELANTVQGDNVLVDENLVKDWKPRA